jgi:hypothetical protein
MAALVETIDILTLSDLTPIENVRKMWSVGLEPFLCLKDG